MTANQLTFAVSRAVVCLSVGLILAGAPAAFAQDCNADVGALMKKRMDMMEQLNANAKANKGKLDPVAGCTKLKGLVAVDREILAYFTKNKEWCSIPDDATANIQADVDKTGTVANQACTIAAQRRRRSSRRPAAAAHWADKRRNCRTARSRV